METDIDSESESDSTPDQPPPPLARRPPPVLRPRALPNFLVNMPLQLKSPLFGGGAEEGTPNASGRRIRWLSRRGGDAFLIAQRQVKSRFWEMCRGVLDPLYGLSKIQAADAIVVSEDIVALTDANNKIIPAKPLMPPNTTIQLTGFILLHLDQNHPDELFIDLICTTPGRSQGKALISFVIQKARELGFDALRMGATEETIPVKHLGFKEFMQYLEKQTIFKPKLNGHLVQFLVD